MQASSKGNGTMAKSMKVKVRFNLRMALSLMVSLKWESRLRVTRAKSNLIKEAGIMAHFQEE